MGEQGQQYVQPDNFDPVIYELVTLNDGSKYHVVIYNSHEEADTFPAIEQHPDVFYFDPDYGAILLKKTSDLDPSALLDAIQSDPFEALQIVPADVDLNAVFGLETDKEIYDYTAEFVDKYKDIQNASNSQN